MKMTITRARAMLNAAKDGQDISKRTIDAALRELGELDDRVQARVNRLLREEKAHARTLNGHWGKHLVTPPLITIYSDDSCNQPEIER